MKKIDKFLIIPVLAALTVGCSSPVAFQSSEYDDVYYSSKDKTTIQDRVVASASTDEAEGSEVTDENAVPNPEYSEKNSGTGYSSRDYASTEDYYSDDYLYSSRRYAPYRSGLSYYDLAYNDFNWYNRNPLLYGRSPFYDPFYSYSYYDPFFNPYFDYGFRYPRVYNGLTVVLGRPYYGGFYGGYPYYGGYGGGFNRGFYGGGVNGYYANSGWYRNDTNSATKVQYGPRRERSTVPTGNANTNTGGRSRGDIGGVAPGGGGGVVAPNGRSARPANADVRSTRSRTAGTTETAPDVEGGRRNTVDMARPTDAPERATRIGRQDRNLDNQVDLTEQPSMERPTRRARVETNDNNFPDQPSRSMEERPSVRPRSERSTESYSQPQRREEYQPERTERQQRVRETYRAEPTYEAPRRERSYEAPRYETPRSYDQPSSRPSYGGGSNDGGGSSGGRGGRPRN